MTSLGWMLLVSLACVLLRRRVRRRARSRLILLTLLSGVVWLRGDQRVEGVVLWAWSKTHGVTISDLLVVVPIAAAFLVWAEAFRHRPAR